MYLIVGIKFDTNPFNGIKFVFRYSMSRPTKEQMDILNKRANGYFYSFKKIKLQRFYDDERLKPKKFFSGVGLKMLKQ